MHDEKGKLFTDLQDKESVVIVLSKYQLDSIPPEIGTLKNAKALTISMDSLHGWTVYPPISALDQKNVQPPFKKLPHEITSLTNLKELTIHGLNIRTLPDDFGNLKELEYLDLTMNKLMVSDELDKLRKLKNLKYLVLSGNRVDTIAMKAFEKENPGIQIVYK
jgi:Leucine-rich repeat (LRR) protein